MWRKNRRQNDSGSKKEACNGVDLNRLMQNDLPIVFFSIFFFLHKQEFPDRLQAHKDKQRPLQGGIRGLNSFLKLISPICGEARCA